MTKASTTSSLAIFRTLQWMRKNKFRPVPLHHQSKASVVRDYVAVDYQPPGDELWATHDYGVGCVTGPHLSGPVDIDLDCSEAVFFAERFLPPTPAVFGRQSKPKSHYIYRVDVPVFDKQAFFDPKAKSVIVEARGDGGHQTVFPGSLHETTGELIQWAQPDLDPEVPTVPAADLMRAVRKVALAVLVARYIWGSGNHNHPTLYLTGTLFYLEWTLAETEQFIRALMDFDGDTDKSRIMTVRNTFKRGQTDRKVAGAGVLRKTVKDDELVDKLLELAGSPTVNLLNEYNDRFAVVSLKGKFRIAGTDVKPSEALTFYVKDDWLNMMATDYSDERTATGGPISKAKLWLSNPRRRSYDSVDFLPGAESPPGILNLWTGWALEPEVGDCSAWLELLRDVVCGGDDKLNEWVLHWFASITREPCDKPLTAPVIIGPEGAGKSLLLAYFGRVLGPGYVVVTNPEHIHGRFNAHMAHALLLHSEEALYGGDKKHASIIRSLITDNFRMFEQKGIDAQQIKNYTRLIMTSNEAHAAPARSGDRRYTVIDMNDRKASDALIGRVLAEMKDNRGPAALFQHLLTMDYDPKLPRLNVKNEALVSLKEHNMEPLESWWYDTLCEGAVVPDSLRWATKPDDEEHKDWPLIVSSSALHVALTIRWQSQRCRGPVPSPAALARKLDKFVGLELKRKQMWGYDKPVSGDGLPPVHPLIQQMSERQYTVYNMPTLERCRAAFEKYVGQSIKWPEPADPAPQHSKY